jgi:hypothetical protein
VIHRVLQSFLLPQYAIKFKTITFIFSVCVCVGVCVAAMAHAPAVKRYILFLWYRLAMDENEWSLVNKSSRGYNLCIIDNFGQNCKAKSS